MLMKGSSLPSPTIRSLGRRHMLISGRRTAFTSQTAATGAIKKLQPCVQTHHYSIDFSETVMYFLNDSVQDASFGGNKFKAVISDHQSQRYINISASRWTQNLIVLCYLYEHKALPQPLPINIYTLRIKSAMHAAFTYSAEYSLWKCIQKVIKCEHTFQGSVIEISDCSQSF